MTGAERRVLVGRLEAMAAARENDAMKLDVEATDTAQRFRDRAGYLRHQAATLREAARALAEGGG